MYEPNDTTDPHPMTRPLAALVLAALAMHAAAEEAWHECDCTAAGADKRCDHYAELCAQSNAVESARASVIAAGEPRTWLVRAGDINSGTVEAANVDDALEQVASRLYMPDYAENGQAWARLWFYCELTDEAEIRTVWIGDPQPREWTVLVNGHDHSPVTASTAAEALELARARLDIANLKGIRGAMWVNLHVHCDHPAEDATKTIQIDQPEPACHARDGHEWRSPHSVVGGDPASAVLRVGGAVITSSACPRCGCGRKVAEYPADDAGERPGQRVTEYTPGRYASRASN